MNIVKKDRIWQFDVDDTLIIWQRDAYTKKNCIHLNSPSGLTVELLPHSKNINLLMKLSKIGWYIRVHSGSGWEWAHCVVVALGLTNYVDEVTSKPLGNTDDKGPGDGIAYNIYRHPVSGEETA